MKPGRLTLCGLFTALISILSIISIPLPAGVPISLATLGVYLCALLLPPSLSLASVSAYVALVALGVPFTAKGGAGVGYLLGPTGGFIFGYLVLAFIIGIIGIIPRARDAVAVALGTLCFYAVATVWFVAATGGGGTFASALGACVLPFLPGDILKIVVSLMLSARLKPYLRPKIPAGPSCGVPDVR